MQQKVRSFKELLAKIDQYMKKRSNVLIKKVRGRNISLTTVTNRTFNRLKGKLYEFIRLNRQGKI